MELSNDVTEERLFSAFGLVTGLPPSRFQIDNAPKKFWIENVTEQVVIDLLNSQTTKYEFTLLQNITENNKRPIEQVKYLQTYKSILISVIPEVISSYNIFTHAYEIIAFTQEFSYVPYVIQVTTDTVYFNLSIRRNGTLYGIVMEKNADVPNPRQMKNGLSSTNFLLDTHFYIKLPFVYPIENRGQSFISKIGNFSNLYDDTEYDAYFIGDNDLPVNPDLMKAKNIQKVSFKTKAEIFVIPDTYRATFSERGVSLAIIIFALFFTIISLI